MTNKNKKITQKDVFEKYKVKNIVDLETKMRQTFSDTIDNLQINDGEVYLSFQTILKEIKKTEYNPLQEKILLFNIFTSSVYNFSSADFSFLVEGLGVFKTYYLFKDVLENNLLYILFYDLYKEFLERHKNLGLTLLDEGRKLMAFFENKLKSLNPEVLKDLIEEFASYAEKTGLAEKIDIKQ